MGLCNRTSYIAIYESKEQVAILQMIHAKYEGDTKKEVGNDIFAHKVQAKMDHYTDAKFKLQVSQKLLKIAP